jgi:predicted  nucleic acid-binding Zn-ribbon protein
MAAVQPPTLPEDVRLRREAASAASEANRLRRLLERSQQRADEAATAARDLRTANDASNKETARLRREIQVLRERCTVAERECYTAQEMQRKLQARVVVGRKDAALIEHLKATKAELRHAKDDNERLQRVCAELESQLRGASEEVEKAALALEAKADAFVEEQSVGEDAALEALARAEEAVSETMRAATTPQERVLARVKVTSLLLEIGEERFARRKMEQALAEAREALFESAAELSRVRGVLTEEEAKAVSLTERAATIAADLEEERSKSGALQSALSQATRERDATLEEIVVLQQCRGELESRVDTTEGELNRVREERDGLKREVGRLESEMEGMKRVTQRVEESLGVVRGRAEEGEKAVSSSKERIDELEERAAALADDVERLSDANSRLQVGNDRLRAAAKEAQEALGRTRGELASLQRKHEESLAASRSSGETLRRELTATLSALEKAVTSQQQSERHREELRVKLSATESANRGLQEQVAELTQSLSDARSSRSMLQSSLGEQMTALRAGLASERRARHAAEAQLASLRGSARGSGKPSAGVFSSAVRDALSQEEDSGSSGRASTVVSGKLQPATRSAQDIAASLVAQALQAQTVRAQPRPVEDVDDDDADSLEQRLERGGLDTSGLEDAASAVLASLHATSDRSLP